MTGTERGVLFVESSTGGIVGGPHRSLSGLVRSLDVRFRPRVIVYAENAVAQELRLEGIVVDVWDPPMQFKGAFDWRAASNLGERILRCRGFLRRHRIELVHLNNSPIHGFVDWLPAARLVRIPCISHARYREPSPPGTAVGQFLMRRFDRVVAVSHYARDAIVAAGVPAERAEVIYNGIDAEEFRTLVTRSPAEERARLGVENYTFLIVMVGHLHYWRGQDVAVEALRRLRPDLRARVQLLLVGARPTENPAHRRYQQALDDAIAAAALSDNVRSLGYSEDVANLMNAADLVLHASTSPEPFGRVLLEGMALGKPIVASGLGGAAEVITPECGVTFDPARPAELAGLLERLMNDSEWRRQLGAGGAARVREFSLAANVARTEALYDELLARRRR